MAWAKIYFMLSLMGSVHFCNITSGRSLWACLMFSEGKTFPLVVREMNIFGADSDLL